MLMKSLQLWVMNFIVLCSIAWLTSCDTADNPVNPEQRAGFFSSAINKLIDDNYEQLKTKSWAELRIPADMFDHTAFAIPANAASDMNCVIKAGYQTFVNGGSVRDAISGQAANDVDFTTDALPEQLVDIVPNTKLFTAPNGYLVAQAWHGDKECTDMGTMRAIYWFMRGKPGIPESSNPATGTSLNVYSKNLWEDSFTRDLTINALYYDYQTGDILDFHGGLHDLREGIIRTVVDPDVMFPHSPTDLLRAVRLAARYNYTIEPVTDAGIRKHLSECDVLGASGIAYHLIKGFHDGNMSATYRLYKEYGFLGRFFLMLKDVLDTKEYEDYIVNTYAELDKQHCKDTPTTLGALFLPVIRKAMGDKAWTEENLLKVFNELEESSGQNKYFEITDDIKADMCRIWAQTH